LQREQRTASANGEASGASARNPILRALHLGLRTARDQVRHGAGTLTRLAESLASSFTIDGTTETERRRPGRRGRRPIRAPSPNCSRARAARLRKSAQMLDEYQQVNG
jgi:hypothetical protein